MDSLQQDLILEFHPDTLQAVRKMYNLDKPGRLREAIDIMREWIKKQDHFTFKEFDDDYLERLIIRNKGLLERAKKNLDKICTTKTLVPQYFEFFDLKEGLGDLHVLRDIVMPKMTSDNYRIYINKHIISEYTDTFVLSYCRKSSMIWEYLLKHDYSAGCIMIIDVSAINLWSLVMKMEINVMREALDILLGCYTMRLKQMHIISSSKAVDAFVAIFKQLMSKKLSDRIYVHADKESLKNMIEPELLPEEYGGKEPPINELYGKWLDVLSSKEHVDYLKKIHEIKTDESLRKRDKFNDQYFGTPGTFRSMIVD